MANEQRLIDANALLERLASSSETWAKNIQAIRNWWPHAVGIKDNIVSSIKEAPTVSAVEVVHAHWEDGYAIHNGKEVYKSIDCSHCNDIFKIESETREYWKERFKVCPFCGALMDGGNEDG